MPEDSLQTAARLARRMPGYRWVRRRAVPRIRQSAAARTLAHRMFPSQSNGSGPPVDVAPGKLLAGVGVEWLPVVLLSLVGLAEDAVDSTVSSTVIDAVIDEVAALQLLGAGFRPVFLLDTPAFSRARSYGYLAELVTAASSWAGDHAGVAGIHRRSGCLDDQSVRSFGGPHDWSIWSGPRNTSLAALVRVSRRIAGIDSSLDLHHECFRCLPIRRKGLLVSEATAAS